MNHIFQSTVDWLFLVTTFVLERLGEAAADWRLLLIQVQCLWIQVCLKVNQRRGQQG